MVDTLRYFSYQPMHHDWINKALFIKDPLQLIEKSSPCSGGSGYPNGSLLYARSHITVNIMS